MPNLKETAAAYEPPKIRNVTDLDFISVEMQVQEEKEVEYPYFYIMVEGERYKVPVSVLSNINDILQASPKITKFKVKKSGEGMKTKYSVIPLI